MVSHHHEGFWLDVSTLRNFYDVNLQLASSEAPLSVEEIHKGIVSRGAAPRNCTSDGMPSASDLHRLISSA